MSCGSIARERKRVRKLLDRLHSQCDIKCADLPVGNGWIYVTRLDRRSAE